MVQNGHPDFSHLHPRFLCSWSVQSLPLQVLMVSPNTKYRNTLTDLLYRSLGEFYELARRLFNENRHSCTNSVFSRNKPIISLYPFQTFSWIWLSVITKMNRSLERIRWYLCPLPKVSKGAFAQATKKMPVNFDIFNPPLGSWYEPHGKLSETSDWRLPLHSIYLRLSGEMSLLKIFWSESKNDRYLGAVKLRPRPRWSSIQALQFLITKIFRIWDHPHRF
jgi:hypothetical protein